MRDGLFAWDHGSLYGVALFDDLPHTRFDFGKVFGCDGVWAVNIIVKTVLLVGPIAALFGIELVYCACKTCAVMVWRMMSNQQEFEW